MASNPGEGSLSGSYSANGVSNENGQEAHVAPVTDPMIVQGIYAPSGIDMMKILVRRTLINNTVLMTEMSWTTIESFSSCSFS